MLHALRRMVEHDFRRGVLHVDIHADVVDGRFIHMVLHRLERRLMREVVWRKALLLRHLERIHVLERRLVHALRDWRLECLVEGRLLTSMQCTF